MKRICYPIILLSLVFLPLAGCDGEEEDTRLFAEDGTWSLQQYTEGGPSSFGPLTLDQKDAFLLKFFPTGTSGGNLAAANCYKIDGQASVNNSICDNRENNNWDCSCFAYTYQNDTMLWQEYQPGEEPPVVGAPAAGGGDTDGGETDGGGSEGPGGVTEVELEADETKANTYIFEPMPVLDDTGIRLFSDADMDPNTRFKFQKKSDTIYTVSQCGVICGLEEAES